MVVESYQGNILQRYGQLNNQNVSPNVTALICSQNAYMHLSCSCQKRQIYTAIVPGLADCLGDCLILRFLRLRLSDGARCLTDVSALEISTLSSSG